MNLKELSRKLGTGESYWFFNDMNASKILEQNHFCDQQNNRRRITATAFGTFGTSFNGAFDATPLFLRSLILDER